MKFLSIADWTGIIETELFAQTYKSYGLAIVRYPVLEIEARVEPPLMTQVLSRKSLESSPLAK